MTRTQHLHAHAFASGSRDARGDVGGGGPASSTAILATTGRSRTLAPAERIVDVLDRVATMSSTVVVSLKGPIPDGALEQALRAVERRHPLLRARIDRRGTPRFVLGEGKPVALRWLDAPKERIDAFVEEALVHRAWADEGPRAELTHLRHALGHTTLIFTAHAVVCDATSGMIVVGDLLRALAGVLPSDEVPSPGQAVLTKETRLRALVTESLAFLRSRLARPFRVGVPTPVKREVQAARLSTIELDVAHTERLMVRMHKARVDPRALIAAALARAVAAEGAGRRALRAVSQIDVRSALDDAGFLPAIGDAVGYYATLRDADFVVHETDSLEALARILARGTELEGASLDTLLAASPASKLATLAERALGVARLRRHAERAFFASSFVVSHVGPPESYGVESEVGALTVTRAFAVSAPSVTGALFATSTVFDGCLGVRIGAYVQSVPPELLQRIVTRVHEDLVRFADHTDG